MHHYHITDIICLLWSYKLKNIMRNPLKKPIRKKYKIKIKLSTTTLLDYNSKINQDKIYFLTQDSSHIMVLNGEYIFTPGSQGILIKIHQN